MENIEGLRHVFPDRKLAVFVTPKCGSSSLAKWFVFQRGYIPLIERARTPEGGDIHTMTNIFATRTMDRLARVDFAAAIEASDRTWHTVKFVRNPYRRAVSAFLQILTLMNNSVELSFREFMHLPRYYFSNAGVPHINTGEPHARLQATSAEVEGKLKISQVFALEDGLKDSSSETFAENRLETKNPRLSGANEVPAPDLVFSGTALAAGASVPSIEEFLTDDLKALIYDRYREDFEVYGFDRDSGNLPAHRNTEQSFAPRSTNRMVHFLRQNSWEEDYVTKAAPEVSYNPTGLSQRLVEHDAVMARCQDALSRIDAMERLVVYGSGELLLNMILSTDIGSKNIVGVTASSLDGIQHTPLLVDNLAWSIIPKDYLMERMNLIEFDKVLIASIAAAPEIKQTLAGRLFRVPVEKIVSLD